MIEQALQLHKRYKKMVEGFKEEDFKSWFLEFFALYPFITKIQWVQYTPYFNDGDECVFSVNDPEVELSALFVEKNPEISVGEADYPFGEEDLDEEERSHRFLGTYSNRDKIKAVPQLSEAMASLKTLFEAEDILRHVFGEHSEVVVTPDAIVIEEHEHD